ncbi:MAG: 2-oxoacid:acceptor oxidoreductase subunit alpha, partial [Promethearchaeia archaeon]
WPFPEQIVANMASEVEHVIVAEQNMGQIYHMVKGAASPTPIHLMQKPTGMPQLPTEIIAKIKEIDSI